MSEQQQQVISKTYEATPWTQKEVLLLVQKLNHNKKVSELFTSEKDANVLGSLSICLLSIGAV